eukprot:5593768-Pyramimonas_sp.AAC.1
MGMGGSGAQPKKTYPAGLCKCIAAAAANAVRATWEGGVDSIEPIVLGDMGEDGRVRDGLLRFLVSWDPYG